MVMGGELIHGVGHFLWNVIVIGFSRWVDRGGGLDDWCCVVVRRSGVVGWRGVAMVGR